MAKPMTSDLLSRVEAHYQEIQRQADEDRVIRNDCIRQALSEGWTHAAIAEATGLTRGRVGQIAMADKNAA